MGNEILMIAERMARKIHATSEKAGVPVDALVAFVFNNEIANPIKHMLEE